MALPTVLVEVAFATAPDDPSPVWVDVTQWTRALDGVGITRGRLDEFSEVQPSRCSPTLINSDGRFTAGNVNSPYFPNVKKGRRLRVSVTWDAVTYRRFTGYVDEWPVTWADASVTVADAPISASSRLSRLGRGTQLRSIVEEEYLLDDPVAYYPLGEGEGSTAAGNVSVTTQPNLTIGQSGSGGTLTFGTATGPGTDELPAPTFTRVDSVNGKYLTAAPVGLDDTADTAMLVEAFFNTSTAARVSICSLTTSAGTGGETIELYVEPGGQLVGRHRANGATDTGGFEILGGATVANGATHHAALKLTVSAGAVTGELFRDGVSVVTSSARTDITLFSVGNFSVGGGAGLVPFNGTIAHAAVSRGSTAISAARITAHYNAGANGFSGERSDQRIARLAGYAGVPSAEVTTETGLSTSMAAQLTTGRTAAELMADVVATESGLLFDARGGNLTFHARSHRYNTASTLTLSGDAGELVPPLEPRLDDQGMVNDITVTREGGVSARAVDQDSITDYGLYRTSVQLFTTSDNEVYDAANWKVFTAATPQVRVPVAVVALEIASSAQITALLELEIGDRITLSGLPSQAPATSMDFFIEGYAEQITAESHRIAFSLSPASLSGVWQLDSSIYSVLGSTTRLGYADLLLPALIGAMLLGAEPTAFAALPAAASVLLAVLAPRVTSWARRRLHLRMGHVAGSGLQPVALRAPALPSRVTTAELLVRMTRWARRASRVSGSQAAQHIRPVRGWLAVPWIAAPAVVTDDVVQGQPVGDGAAEPGVQQPVDVPVPPVVVDLGPAVCGVAVAPAPAFPGLVYECHNGRAGVRGASPHVCQCTKSSEHTEDGC